jgi:hypothetical protein
VLGESAEEHVPPLVTGGGRLLRQQAEPLRRPFPPVLLKELRDQPPAQAVSIDGAHVAGQVAQRHRPVLGHTTTVTGRRSLDTFLPTTPS